MAPLGFIGGGYLAAAHTNGRPIEFHPTPRGTPKWGTQVEEGDRATTISACTSVGTHGA